MHKPKKGATVTGIQHVTGHTVSGVISSVMGANKFKLTLKNGRSALFGFVAHNIPGKHGWYMLHRDPFTEEMCYSQRDYAYEFEAMNKG